MAINYPDTPAVNDIYTVGLRVWRWNGEGWERVINAGQIVQIFTLLEGPFVEDTVTALPQPFGMGQWTLLTHI